MRAGWLWLGAMGILGGCAAPPEAIPTRVSIDFSRIERPAAVAGAPLEIPARSVAAANGSMPGLPARNLYAARAVAEVRRAEAAIKAARDKGVVELRAEIERTFRNRAERQYESELGRLDDQLTQINADVLAEIRDEFNRHAEARTPILYDLSKKAGFPAETRRSQRFQRTRELMFPKLEQEIEALRAELLREDAVYLANRARILGRAKLESEEAEVSMQNRRAELLERSQAQARAFLARALAESKATAMDAGDLLEVSERIPPASGASVRLPGLQAKLPVVPGPLSAARISLPELVKLAEIWAKTRHYVLVEQPEPATDATIEFQIWLKTVQVGR